jgi:hypothetical protein
MATDARISTGLPGHPKTKKLVRRLGAAAGWSLLCLILWARANRPNGDLTGMSTEDIELAADWTGENDTFVRELVAVGFVEGEEGAYALHDWAEHQPWAAGSEARSAKSRWAALCKQHGRLEAARLMPEYAERLAVASQPHAAGVPLAPSGLPLAETGSAPSPSPSPSPSPNTPLTPQGGQREPHSGRPNPPGHDDPLFVAFYGAYPRKTGRADAWKAWRALKATPPLVHDILAGLAKWRAHERWTKDGGRFIKHPGSWLRDRLWEDEEVCGGGTPGAPAGVPDWVARAGFDNEAHAANLRCYAHNASQFRDGKRIPAEIAA